MMYSTNGIIKDKPVSKLTQADLIMAELNLPQQIKQEKIKPPILKSEVIPGRMDPVASIAFNTVVLPERYVSDALILK